LGLCPHFDQLHEIFGNRILTDTNENSEDDDHNSLNQSEPNQFDDVPPVVCKIEPNLSDSEMTTSTPLPTKPSAVEKQLSIFQRAAKRQILEEPQNPHMKEGISSHDSVILFYSFGSTHTCLAFLRRDKTVVKCCCC